MARSSTAPRPARGGLRVPVVGLACLALFGCGSGGPSAPASTALTVTATAGTGGTITPASVQVKSGGTATFTLKPSDGYAIDSVTGCGGTSKGNSYTTAPVTASCAVSASFARVTHAVTAKAEAHGSISPGSVTVNDGDTATFAVTPDDGYAIDTVTGCGGTLAGNGYTTGAVTADCTVTARFIATHVVIATAGANGTISPSSATVKDGATTTFTLTPGTGYAVDAVTGCGGTLSGNVYTTGAITAGCVVSATFAVAHTVTATAGTGGTIDPGRAFVKDGATATFTVTPEDGYAIDSVTGCGGTLNGSSYTTGPVTADCTVTASFILTHVVTATAGAHGAISPSSVTVNDGASAAFTVTPDSGYAIDSITGCGGTLAGYSYTTGPVTADCTVTVSFVSGHTVTASAGTGGTISPGTFTVKDGGTVSFTVTPSNGYAIQSVTGCGGTLSGDSYTTGPVTSTCAVSASFYVDFTDGQRASVVIGQSNFTSSSGETTQTGLWYPEGNVDLIDGTLYLADNYNHRLLGFDAIPTTNGAPASFVIGAPDFTEKGSMAEPHSIAAVAGELFAFDFTANDIAVYDPIPTTSTAEAPSFTIDANGVGGFQDGDAVSAGGGKLVAADGDHNRVLIWNTIPTSNVSPNLVLGQQDFMSTDANRGGNPGQNTMFFPDGVWTDGQRLVVLDQQNNRVLIWNTFPTVNGQQADLVLGQADFTGGQKNRGAPASAGTMNSPVLGVWVSGDQLFVADSDNGRVLIWNHWPTVNGQPADAELGQADLESVDLEGTQTRMKSPTGVYLVGTKLIVTDDADSRVLIFDATAP